MSQRLLPLLPMSLREAYVGAWLEGLNRRAQPTSAALTVPPRLVDPESGPYVPLRPAEGADGG